MFKTFFYFLVAGNEAFEPQYHENYFVAQNGFLYGLLLALVIACVAAGIFYYVMCNNKRDVRFVTVPTWAITGIIGVIIAIAVADLFLIGRNSETGFYAANEQFYTDQSKDMSDTDATTFSNLKAQIAQDLDENGDVRITYDLTTGFWCFIFFFIISTAIKGGSLHGKVIPFKWPAK